MVLAQARTKSTGDAFRMTNVPSRSEELHNLGFPALRLSLARSSLKTIHWTVLFASRTTLHPHPPNAIAFAPLPCRGVTKVP